MDRCRGCVVGLAVLAVMYIRVAPVELPETRLEITTPPGRLSFSKVSPDGRKVVFSAAAEGKPSQLWLRSFESEAAQPLAGTENAGFPFWSPDSRSIGFRRVWKTHAARSCRGKPAFTRERDRAA